ncbi:MAG TPA: cytochrome c, partial [Gemmatimonadales bacterium]|nr:cytochrome c [Gemmatimonadales bacterium]
VAQGRPEGPPRPPEVTDSAVARGKALFHGAGACSSCHGLAGVGSDSGPPLAEGVWLHGPDSYAGIRARVVHGIPRAYSTRGIAMPMRGWNPLSDREVDDVAAYVWVLSHDWPRRPAARRPPS